MPCPYGAGIGELRSFTYPSQEEGGMRGGGRPFC